MSMAVNELQLGQSDLVVCGGVDTMNDIFMYMCFSKTPALSPSGDCRPFSDKADGTMLGEGIGMVALKRLADAERDGDRIYAVLQGLGSSSDGRAKSVYAPLPPGQAKALRRAYELAGLRPETVELMEAHGTGTKAGDAAEFEGLATVWNESGRTDRQWCALGSVKSQIGHTKALPARRVSSRSSWRSTTRCCRRRRRSIARTRR
jgi:acyl transferase domain-containing protein